MMAHEKQIPISFKRRSLISMKTEALIERRVEASGTTGIRLHETTRTIPFFEPVPLTELPLIYQREHLFPYTSYGATAATPRPRAFSMVVLENAALRVEVAPELGGRV